MIIYLVLLFPIITTVLLLVFFKKRLAWWEISIPFVVSLLVILTAKYLSEFSQTRDTEYWGSLVTHAEYYEDWNEYVHKACTEDYPCGTDSKGNTKYCTRTYDCSYVDYHSEYWMMHTDCNEEFSISKAHYFKLKRQFDNEKFVELNRNYHTDDGDKYVAYWQGNEETARPIVTTHSYKNRIQESQDVFNFETVSDSDKVFYGLFDYPEPENYLCNSVLGVKDSLANKKLCYLNGVLGPKKQTRLWVLVFNNKHRNAGNLQEAYWKGGNKNEFVVCVGVDSAGQKIRWCYPFSWSEVHDLKIDARNFVMAQDSLDLTSIVSWLGSEIDKRFVRKQFADFSYITIEPSPTAIFLGFLIVIGTCIGTSFWIVKNGVE